MAIIPWTTVRDYVIVSSTGFGAGIDPTTLPRIDLADLDGPTTENLSNAKGAYQRWNYGVPNHEIEQDGVSHLSDWFTSTFTGGKTLQVQAKNYGGFVLNLTWWATGASGVRRLFNFHVKINQASLTVATLSSSGATGKQRDDAWSAMFPPLTGSK